MSEKDDRIVLVYLPKNITADVDSVSCEIIFMANHEHNDYSICAMLDRCELADLRPHLKTLSDADGALSDDYFTLLKAVNAQSVDDDVFFMYRSDITETDLKTSLMVGDVTINNDRIVDDI